MDETPIEHTPIDPKLARALLDLDRIKQAANDAYDAIRDGQSQLATKILGEVLGYEPRSEN